MVSSTDTDQFEYYLSSLDELGEILIEADKIESVASGILRLTLGTIMASSGAIFIFHGPNQRMPTYSPTNTTLELRLQELMDLTNFFRTVKKRAKTTKC